MTAWLLGVALVLALIAWGLAFASAISARSKVQGLSTGLLLRDDRLRESEQALQSERTEKRRAHSALRRAESQLADLKVSELTVGIGSFVAYGQVFTLESVTNEFNGGWSAYARSEDRPYIGGSE